MIFFSTSAAQQSPGKPRILGNLTLHGATHPVALFLERVEAHQDGAGHTGIHAVATTQISRKEFGVGLTHGTFMVGDIIEIRLDIEGVSK
jgi:polyisoprenoid-binding protein YceI